MSERNRVATLALLAGLYAAAAVFLAPVDFLEPESYFNFAKFARVGIFLVPPAVLALCAVLGPWALSIRLPLTIWLACFHALLLSYGAWRGDFGFGLADDSGELAANCFFGPLVEFLLLLMPLGLLRAARRWRLEAPVVDAVPESESAPALLARSPGQYTIRAIFAWTLAVASVFSGLRFVFDSQGLGGEGWREALLEGMLQGAMAGSVLTAVGLPALSVAWLLLASGRRLVLRLGLVVVTAGGIAAALAALWQADHDVGSLLAVGGFEAGVIVAALASFAVIRGCGYRLVRRPRGAKVAFQTASNEIASPRRQFAWALAGLSAAAIVVACCVPARLAVWRQAAETRAWAKLGLEVICDGEGRMVCIQGDADRLTDDELRRFAELPDLSILKFEKLRDSQLAAIVAPAGLDTLDIADFRFTDEGLKHLGRIPQLRDLDLSRTSITDAGMAQIAGLKRLFRLRLSATDITDDGLSALAECKELRSLDLTLTAVTEAGARRLSEALPQTQITIGACDALVRSVVLESRGAIRRERLHATGKYQTFGPSRARPMPGGLSMTDSGLKLLNTSMELKDLDLRDTAVTDAGLPALFGLKTLNRIDLRDTAVTEIGRLRLANALPGCEILR